MLKKIPLILSLIIAMFVFSSIAMAQTVGEGTIPVNNSKLTGIDLSKGARRIKDGMSPAEVTEVLQKLIAQGGGSVKQGTSEVVLWGGDYEKAKGAQMIKKLENDLKKSGWTYELAAAEEGVTIFTLMREEPSRTALVGFFAPLKESFIFAVTEMLPADAGASEAKNSSVVNN